MENSVEKVLKKLLRIHNKLLVLWEKVPEHTHMVHKSVGTRMCERRSPSEKKKKGVIISRQPPSDKQRCVNSVRNTLGKGNIPNRLFRRYLENECPK